MIKEIGVAAVPGSSFFREPVNNLIRLHFARGQNVLDEALGRLEKMAQLLSQKGGDIEQSPASAEIQNRSNLKK